ncbi:TetR/AcrR family transcriptional regulator [Nocardia sp. CDC159]|uniref:TetR/AcrR family transcriptional regulator n=1 Tax=Nocardia pulmonis TaxID=2951408 RepID=A0A9X2E8R8_9NOCA|nr:MULTISPECIES: TetR/AcrR family transcriptional regulator [Nocardia]MCM6776399.1 TetR/AcrR family transcriptional regulator [Nocardia pulmonis]MCM6788823.1 TetR/AcrR family transcriptional regulator [Nocardia sp. CDC159]
MPRGVAIPEVRQQLFAAAERVILRDGPGRLGGRAITGAAGVATGLLYAHFTDLDGFLAAFAVDRAFVISAEVAGLPQRAGTGEVIETLLAAVLAVPLTTVMASTRLLVARPELTDRVREVLGEATAGLDAFESAAAAYLSAERSLGRIEPAAAPEVLAEALVGVVHHVALTAADERVARRRLERLVPAMFTGIHASTRRGLPPVGGFGSVDLGGSPSGRP